MKSRRFELRLPIKLFERASDIAKDEDISVGHYIRNCMNSDMDNRRLDARIRALTGGEK